MNIASISMAATASTTNLVHDEPSIQSSHTYSNLKTLPEDLKDDSFEDDSLPEPSTASTLSVPDDASEDFDAWKDESDEKCNGTGLILYVTPTATKAPYWKRCLGWKPNKVRSHRHKVKNFFRSPVRRQATVGLRTNKHAGDALLLTTRDPSQLRLVEESSDAVGKVKSTPSLQTTPTDKQWDPNQEYVIADNDDSKIPDKGWTAFRTVQSELVFA